MTHAQLVEKAVRWLRACRCGVVLSEQACVSGEMPDAIDGSKLAARFWSNARSLAPISWPTALNRSGSIRAKASAANAST